MPIADCDYGPLSLNANWCAHARAAHCFAPVLTLYSPHCVLTPLLLLLLLLVYHHAKNADALDAAAAAAGCDAASATCRWASSGDIRREVLLRRGHVWRS
eukprot:332763-Chlamydomonas_euryale.AAC.9